MIWPICDSCLLQIIQFQVILAGFKLSARDWGERFSVETYHWQYLPQSVSSSRLQIPNYIPG